MKKILKTVLLSFLLIASGQFAFAQSTEKATGEVSIGTATGIYWLPVSLVFNESATQTIYYPSELGTNGGEITGITYPIWFDVAWTSEAPIKVWVGETEKTTFSTPNSWVDVSELTLVYEGGIDLPAGDIVDWEIPFNQPYQYQGGNLVIYMVRLAEEFAFNKMGYTFMTPYSRRTIQRAVDEPGSITAENPGRGETMDLAPIIRIAMNYEGMGGISGVVASEDGELLGGAKIELVGTPYETTTNSAGQYSFPYFNTGEYPMKVSLYGYYDETATAAVTAENNTDMDFTLENRVRVTVDGTVTRSDSGAPIEGARITLDGYEYYETRTDADGYWSLPDVWGGSLEYEMTVMVHGYVNYEGTLPVATADITESIELDETPAPVVNLTAAPAENDTEVQIAWDVPGTTPEGTLTAFIWDDGKAESGFTCNEGMSMSMGNLFLTPDEGTITTVGFYTLENPAAARRTVVIDIYDSNRELIVSSEPFIPVAGENMVDLLIPAEFSGDFYAMVRWPHAEAGNTHGLGYDTNGPNRIHGENGYDYYISETGAWSVFNTQLQGIYGVFLVRVQAFVNGEVKTYGHTAFSPAQTGETEVSANTKGVTAKTPFPTAVTTAVAYSSINADTRQPETAFGSFDGISRQQGAPKTVNDYTVYRLLSGQEKDETEWTELETVSETGCTDTGWSSMESGVYRYAVKVNYHNIHSPARFSKDVPKDMTVSYTVNVSTNSNDPVVGARVIITSQDSKHQSEAVIESGTAATLTGVWKGASDITVILNGFDTYTATGAVIADGGSHSAELIESLITPFGLIMTVSPEERSAHLQWNQRAEITVTVGDVWGNRTGYQMLLDNQHSLFGSLIPNIGPIGSCNEPDDFYDVFSHKIPANADPSCYSKNILFNTTTTLFIEPGIYDFCFVNPSPGESLYIAGGRSTDTPPGYGRRDNFEFEPGKKYNFSIGGVGFGDFVFLEVEDRNEGKSAKSVEYSLYLDGELHGTASETSYTFENLSAGTYTAGVKAVYTTGQSGIVEMPFEMTLPTREVKFIVTNQSGIPVPLARIRVEGQGNGGFTDAQGEFVHNPLPDGTYSYTVTKTGIPDAAGNFTVDGADLTIKVTMDVSGINAQSTDLFTIYPNPVNSKLTIARASAGKAAVKIYSITGVPVQTAEISGMQYDMDVSGIGAGIYMLHLIESGTARIHRFVKE